MIKLFNPYIIGGIGVAFMAGWMSGNLHATKRELDATKKEHAEEFGKATWMIAEAYNKQRKADEQRLNDAVETQREADAAAYAVLEQGRADAEAAAQQARASLRIALSEAMKQKETNDGLRNVADILASEARAPDPPCELDSRMRSILDYASGAVDSPGPGIAEADSASIPVAATEESASPPNGLTCDQLTRGYVGLAAWGREGWVLYRAWQEYWSVLNAETW